MRLVLEVVAIAVAVFVLWVSTIVHGLACSQSEPCSTMSKPVIIAVLGVAGLLGVITFIVALRRGRRWAAFVGVLTLAAYVVWLVTFVLGINEDPTVVSRSLA